LSINISVRERGRERNEENMSTSIELSAKNRGGGERENRE
jgi:hypothetical protein